MSIAATRSSNDDRRIAAKEPRPTGRGFSLSPLVGGHHSVLSSCYARSAAIFTLLAVACASLLLLLAGAAIFPLFGGLTSLFICRSRGSQYGNLCALLKSLQLALKAETTLASARLRASTPSSLRQRVKSITAIDANAWMREHFISVCSSDVRLCRRADIIFRMDVADASVVLGGGSDRSEATLTNGQNLHIALPARRAGRPTRMTAYQRMELSYSPRGSAGRVLWRDGWSGLEPDHVPRGENLVTEIGAGAQRVPVPGSTPGVAEKTDSSGECRRSPKPRASMRRRLRAHAGACRPAGDRRGRRHRFEVARVHVVEQAGCSNCGCSS